MQALLKGGPVAGEIRPVDEPPPHHIDVEVTEDPLLDVPEGGEYQHASFVAHRYVLSGVNGDQRAPEPRAWYSWLQRLPS
jgi:hypothetical protein